MTTRNQSQPRGGTHRLRNTTLFLAILVAIGVTGYRLSAGSEDGEGTRQATYENLSQEEVDERTAIYLEAENKGKELVPNWPGTEQQLIMQFWTALANKDIERACVLCPGSKPDDFAMFQKFTPQPATAIGHPEPHPQHPEVQLWPVTVPFPGFPKKTVKMAILRMDDGRLGINGQHTIWW
jgi:hypothetical protein